VERAHFDWPFFADAHRVMARDLDAWCAAHLADGGSGHEASDVDSTCRAHVRALGAAGTQ
jgi:acyl-CoA dehydrogenase